MKRLLLLPILLTALTYMACQDQPGTPEPPGPALPEGGTPGPPPHVILPDGPPPQAPAPAGAGPPMRDLIAIGAGNAFSCALRSGGAAFCWGANGSGQLGDGTTTSSTVPVAVTGGLTFTQLVVGDLHACGITAGQAAHCWGLNDLNGGGQLGDGTTTSSTVPVAVVGGHSFNSLSAGMRNTCGIATDGVTYCWGQGGSNVPVPVVGSLALGFQVVSKGIFWSTCATTTSTGDVYCWGLFGGLFGNGGAVLPPGSPTPVAAASGMTLATIDAGTAYNCGLDAGGTAFCWGLGAPIGNAAAQQGNGTFSSSNVPLPVVGGLSFTFLDAHPHNWVLAHTCGITTSGDTYCWGDNTTGQLGAPSSDTCSFSGDFDCSTSPLEVLGHHQFSSVAVGIQHTCGVTVAGRAFCWGENLNGQLGDGTVQDKKVPVPVRGP